MPEPVPNVSGIVLIPLIAFCAFSAGCRDREVAAYRIPKEADSAVATVPAPGRAPAAGHWAAAPDWQAQPASGMRVGSYRAPGPGGDSADVSIISLPGEAGDDLANLNRWRGQVQLPPISAEEMARQTGTLATPAGRFITADLDGRAGEKNVPTRLVGGWLRQSDRAWFFKMMGPPAAVAAQKAAFEAMLRSFSLSSPADGTNSPPGATGTATANTNDLPTAPREILDLSAPPPAMPVGTVQTGAGASLLWQAPPSWTSKPGGGMRKGSYTLGPGGAVELAITSFPGDVGGPLANANRWLGQVGQPGVAEGELSRVATPLSANGLDFLVIDTGPGKASDAPRIVAGLVSWRGDTWFFKLMGPGGKVGEEKAGFLAFLRTVRAP